MMQSLPTELLYQISFNLKYFEVLALAQSCSTLYKVFANLYWKHRLIHFNLTVPFNIYTSWHYYYRKVLINTCNNIVELYDQTHFVDLILSGKTIYHYNKEEKLWQKVMYMQFFENCMIEIAKKYGKSKVCQYDFLQNCFKQIKEFVPRIKVGRAQWLSIKQQMINLKTGQVRPRVREDYQSHCYDIVYKERPCTQLFEWMQQTFGDQQNLLRKALRKIILSVNSDTLHLQTTQMNQAQCFTRLLNYAFELHVRCIPEENISLETVSKVGMYNKIITYGPADFPAKWHLTLNSTSVCLQINSEYKSALLNWLVKI